MRTLLRLAALVAAIGLLGAVAVGLWVRGLTRESFPATLPEPVAFEVAPGSAAGAVLDDLERAGLINDARVARLLLRYRLDAAPIQAGEYKFRSPATMAERLQRLVDGDVVLHPVTVVEGLTAAETAAALAAAGLGSEAAFLAAMGDPTPILDLDPAATDLEGYLFPDTYSLPRGITESELVELMVRNFRSRYQRVLEPLVAATMTRESPPRGLREVVTLASIVEKEARLDEERGLIAGVYAHRLRRGIALYADPTVIFGLKLLGRWDGNLRKADLSFDTPYNTYVRSGLPPGPICSVGIASLKAAAAPASTDYLYFVSRNDGSHIFAKTLREHNRNVQTWQKQYWRERWERERREKAAG